MATSGFATFGSGVGTEQYYGGAPRFDSASTFLGKKVEALADSGQVMTQARRAEVLLGKNERSRYGNVLDSLKDSDMPVMSGLDLLDFKGMSKGLVDSQLAQLEKLPNGFDAKSILAAFSEIDKLKVAAQPMQKVQEGGFDMEKMRMMLGSASIPVSNATSELGMSVVGLAAGYLGINRYKYGAFDCSKFTQEVAKKAGIDISRSTASQMSFFQKKKQWGGIKDARPGDILYFRSSASASGRHTGVYIGNGMMIDNAGSGKPIAMRKIAGRVLLGVGLLSKWGPQPKAPAKVKAPSKPLNKGMK